MTPMGIPHRSIPDHAIPDHAIPGYQVTESSPNLEQISARLEAVVAAVMPGTVERPKRVHWSDGLTADGAARISQGRARTIFSDDAIVFFEQPIEVAICVIDPDASETSVETACGRWMAAVVRAISADTILASLAGDGGVRMLEQGPFIDESGRLSGKWLHISILYQEAL